MPEPIRILLVEDNPADARLLAESLKESGPDAFRVTQVARLSAAIEAVGGSPADVVLLDLSLPDSSGLGTVERMRAVAPNLPIVVLTGLQDEALGLQAVRMGVQDYLVKGMCEGGLAARALLYAVERRRAEAALREAESRVAAEAAALARLNELSSRLWQMPGLNAGLEEMLHATIALLGADKGNIQLLEGGVLRIVAHHGFAGPFLDHFREVTVEDDTACARALRSGETVVIEDVEADAPYAPLRPVAREAGYRAVLSMPLVGRNGDTLGMVSVHFQSPHRPSDLDLHRLTLYARHAAGFIERCRAEAALRSAEEQLRTITDAVPAHIGYIDKSGRFLLNNRAYETWFGVPRDAVAGRHMSEVLGDAVWEKVRPRVERALAGEEVHYEDRLPYSGGGARWVSGSYTPYRGPSGEVEGIVALVNDISDRKVAEEAVRESEARFRTMADDAPVLIWVNGPDGAEFVNRTYVEFLGVEGDVDVRGYDWAQFVHPDDRDAYVNAYLDCLARRAEFTAQFRFRHRDGDYHWMTSTGRPRFTAAGEFLGYVGSTVDITDIKRADEAVRESEARLRAVVETAVDAIITIDERGTIESLNPSTERLFGYGRDELVGRNVSRLMPEPYRGEHDGYLQRYLSTGQARIIGVGREVLGLRNDGTVFPLDLSVSEFRVGERRMFTGILHDITTRRRLEREILEASANEQRRIGHELHDGLCQQLTGAAFSAEILARKLQAKAPDAVPAARRLAEEIDQAITQARTLARGLNPMEVHAEALPSALDDLARKVTETFGISCRFRRDGDGDAALADNGAATHLYRIAQEAVSNAIRHGKAKKVELSLRDGGESLSLSIEDDGAGFAAEGGQVRPREASEGIGLQTMAYRAKLINAVLDVRPGRRRGVVVTCVIAGGASAGRK